MPALPIRRSYALRDSDCSGFICVGVNNNCYPYVNVNLPFSENVLCSRPPSCSNLPQSRTMETFLAATSPSDNTPKQGAIQTRSITHSVKE